MLKKFWNGSGEKKPFLKIINIKHLIENFCRVFKNDCPDGKLHMSKVIEMYSMIIPNKNATVLGKAII